VNPGVITVGSINVDLTLSVSRLPDLGETLLATSFSRTSGGKGANQAVAVALAGGHSQLVGAVGDDAEGAAQLADLALSGVDTAVVQVVEGQPTGLAIVDVTPQGENSIVVVPGANAHLSVDHVCRVLWSASPETLVLIQSEIAVEVIEAAAAVCRERGLRVILNNGPRKALTPATLAQANPLVLNEIEALHTCGYSQGQTEQQLLACEARRATDALSVVVTLGSRGSVISEPGGEAAVPTPLVGHVVNTTGAGDAFVGTLAAHLCAGLALVDAAHLASREAALATTWPGARRSDSRVQAQHV